MRLRRFVQLFRGHLASYLHDCPSMLFGKANGIYCNPFKKSPPQEPDHYFVAANLFKQTGISYGHLYRPGGCH